MERKFKIALSCFIILAAVTLSGCGCRQSNPNQYRLKLEVWGPVDDSDAFMSVFQNYRKLNPNVADIVYKKINYDTYKKELLDALASGQGPDIFLIQNNWLPSFKDKIVPAPAEFISEQKFRNDFADVVANDFLDTGVAYAVPLSVDSLALYYNKDFFNEAGITSPPQT